MRSFALGALAMSLGAGGLQGQIEGVVRTEEGDLVRNVMIDLWGVGVHQRRSPGRDGAFSFRDFVEPQTVWLQAFALGWVSRRVEAVAPVRGIHLILYPTGDTTTYRSAPASPEGQPRVLEMHLATGVVDREPADRWCGGALCGQEYGAGVGRVWCWTRVAAGVTPTEIEHVWFWEEREVARVRIRISGSPWRVWSSKQIEPHATGQWRVDVVTVDGDLLEARHFTVRDTASRRGDP